MLKKCQKHSPKTDAITILVSTVTFHKGSPSPIVNILTNSFSISIAQPFVIDEPSSYCIAKNQRVAKAVSQKSTHTFHVLNF